MLESRKNLQLILKGAIQLKFHFYKILTKIPMEKESEFSKN